MQKTKRVVTLEFDCDDAAEAFVDFLKDAVADCLDAKDNMRIISIENPDLTNAT